MSESNSENKNKSNIIKDIYNRFIEKLNILAMRKRKIIADIDKRIDEKKAQEILEEIKKS
ncbi:MAG: hypothetical protein ABIC82_05750 [bacterium]